MVDTQRKKTNTAVTTDVIPEYAASDDPIYITEESGATLVFQMIEDAIVEGADEELYECVQRVENLLKTVPNFQQKRPKLYQQYTDAIARAQWYLIAFLHPEQIEKLFRDHLVYFFEHQWQEVYAHIQTALFATVPLPQRDEKKQQIREAIASSQFRLGELPLNLAGAPGEPTIQNWLRDIRDFLHGKDATSLAVVEYLNTNENAGQLSDEDRNHLEGLFKLYQELDKSSQMPDSGRTFG